MRHDLGDDETRQSMLPTEFTGWHKAQASCSNGGGCVEVGYAPGAVGIRDTTLGPASPMLTGTPATFAALQHALRAGLGR